MQLLLQNFLFFQIGWFTSIMGAAHGLPWLGILLVTLIIGIHLFLANNPAPEAYLMIIITAVGTIWDSILTTTGFMQFSSGTLIEGVAPYWLIAMWALFATTLNVSLRWLKDRFLLGALFGLLGGPLAYYAGFKLGAVNLPDISASLITIGIGWAVIMPLFLYIASLNDGYRDNEGLAS